MIFGRCMCARTTPEAPVTGGSGGKLVSVGAAKSNAEVRSPLTARCHGLMAGIVMSKRFSRNWPIEVWSITSDVTQPPRLHGETTYIGTRGPIAHGRTLPLMSSVGSVYLPAVSLK